MEELNKKQKTIFLLLLIAMIVVIGAYIFQNAGRNSYEDISEEEILIGTLYQEEKEGEIVVHITGCVAEEGIVRLKEGDRIADAIDSAGGLTMDASIKNVNLAYVLQDGQKIYIPSNIEEDDEEEESIVTYESGEKVIKDEPSNIGIQNINQKININTATQTQLETLSGIGPSTAAKIIEYRTKNGKFTNIEEIKNVSGIGDIKFTNIKDYISVK